MAPTQWGLGTGSPFEALQGRGTAATPHRPTEPAATRSHTSFCSPGGAGSRSGAIFPWWGWAALGRAALTDGFTALVSINEGHDGAQGHVWVIPEALQAADGILDVLCQVRPRGYALGSRPRGQKAPWQVHGDPH